VKSGLARRTGLWDDCGMGNKDKGKKETKKPAKKTPKASPARKREEFSQSAVRIVREATENS
jgi:hypothetical protein